MIKMTFLLSAFLILPSSTGPVTDKTINAEHKDDPFKLAGFQLIESTLNEVPYKIVIPKKIDEQKRWIWRARFWGHEPQLDLALLNQGYHLVYIDVANLFGSESAIKIWNDFYEFIITDYGLNVKVVLEGMSRGGLIVFNWANRNAEKVACIYVDAPVCDFKSWPAKIRKEKKGAKVWEALLSAYGFTEEIAITFNGNPVNHLEHIASHRIPIISVVGDKDETVPVAENTALIEKRLAELGWEMEVIHKPDVGHHPHSLEDPQRILDFIGRVEY